MFEGFFHNFLEVIITALVILSLQLTIIVLASRLGWFLWLIKKILHLRSIYLHKKMKSKGHSHQEE